MRLFLLIMFVAHFSAAEVGKISNNSTQGAVLKAGQKPGLHDLLLKTVKNTAEYFGFGRECKNGGHKTEENQCICPKYFEGDECEKRICLNNGTVIRHSMHSQSCKCADHPHIEGDHCERPVCTHGGTLITHANNTWKCDCNNSTFYQGKYCHKFFISNSVIAIGIVIVLSVLVFCVCSINCCSRPNTPTPTQAAPRGMNRRRVVREGDRGNRALILDDNVLINCERGHPRRAAAYPEGVIQPYVVRLDTIPTFNPQRIGGVEPANDSSSNHPVGPPPSYDQVIVQSPAHVVSPPEYSLYDNNAKADEDS